MQELIFENHPSFLVLCLVLGLGYALFLYQKVETWPLTTHRILFIFRTITVFFIALLLVSPILKQYINNTEKPTFILAWDDSESLAAVRDSAYLYSIDDTLNQLSDRLEENNFNVEHKYLTHEKGASLAFTGEATDLASLLRKIENEYEGRNLAGILLVSDGIYNRGISPSFADYGFQINTLGLGDTIPKSDVAINALLFNRLSYQGNKFPVVIQLKQQGYDGEFATVTISKSGKVVASKQVTMPLKGSLKNVTFEVVAEQSGFHRYVVSVTRKNGELTYDNNVKSAYVEVIEGKEKIALLASSPHPDIKAIQSAVESNSNYAFEKYILSTRKDVQRLQNSAKDFDLVIYHQLPSRTGVEGRILDQFGQKFSSFHIVGGQTQIGSLNRVNPLMTISANRGDYDQVNGAFNSSFEKFDLSDELMNAFDAFPPLSVPFGKYDLKGDVKTVLYQKVGSITTNKPLLSVKTIDEKKAAVMVGTGLWKWKLADYASNGNNNQFNELVTKLIQYLSTKDDKRKFRLYPLKNEYFINERIILETEVYNDLFEEIYGIDIAVKLVDGNGKAYDYQYTTSQENTQFEVSGLPEGIYQYSASTTLQGEKVKVEGQLVVKDIKLETINLTADYTLLRKLSKDTGGDFFGEGELDQLTATLQEKKAVSIMYSQEELLPLINLYWFLILILALISTEWFIRKYYGSY